MITTPLRPVPPPLRPEWRWAWLLWSMAGFAQASGLDAPLMLASPYYQRVDIRDYLVSEKFDGVRARWDGQTLKTRSGYRIHAPAWFTRDWPEVAMDGELWLGRERFEEISALVRSAASDSDLWREVRFMAFDLPEHTGRFAARARALTSVVTLADSPSLQAIPQQRFADQAAFDAFVVEVLAGRGEGVMLHHVEGRYQAGRSESLLKHKPHDDAEARVVDYIEGKGKYHGLVGALLVETADGRRFRLGSGLSDALRRDPPPAGTVVTYRYNGFTRTGLPRFARFLRVREAE